MRLLISSILKTYCGLLYMPKTGMIFFSLYVRLICFDLFKLNSISDANRDTPTYYRSCSSPSSVLYPGILIRISSNKIPTVYFLFFVPFAYHLADPMKTDGFILLAINNLCLCKSWLSQIEK